MSKIRILPNTSGTGTVTLTAPSTSTDRTITLPDNTGDVITTGSVEQTTKVPMFSVKRSSNQSIGDAVNTTIQFNDVEFDTHNAYDTTNHRYVAPVAGYYYISLGVSFDTAGGYIQGVVTLSLRFNGNTNNVGSGRVVLHNGTDNNTTEVGGGASFIVYFNGTTDYMDTQAYMNSDGTRNMLGASGYKNTWMCGHLIRAGAEI